MWIDERTNTRIKNPKELEHNGITYPKQVFNDTATLNSIGVYWYEEDQVPNRRYYTYNESTDDINKRIVKTPIPRDIENMKPSLVNQLNEVGNQLLEANAGKYKSAEMASWAFLVPECKEFLAGGDINNTLQLKIEADGQGIDYTTYANLVMDNYTAFSTYKANVVVQRNIKTAEVLAMTSIEDLIAYESSPYTYLKPITEFVDELDVDGVTVISSAKDQLETYGLALGVDLDGRLTLENMYQQLVDSGATETRYRNKVTDWNM